MDIYSFRFATNEDCSKLYELEKVCNPKAPWKKEFFEAELLKKESKILILTDDETDEIIAGYCVYLRAEGYTEILLLGISLLQRNMGFASRLIRQVIRESITEEAGRILLNVRVGNAAAISLYQKLFFNITHQKKAFYSDGEDAYEMELSLTHSVSILE